jgi:hypothetical protein
MQNPHLALLPAAHWPARLDFISPHPARDLSSRAELIGVPAVLSHPAPNCEHSSQPQNDKPERRAAGTRIRAT